MKKLSLILLTCLCIPAWGMVSLDPLLNKVSLRLRAESWVTTKTAQVTVTVNAAVSGQGIDQIQSGVLQKLSTLANASWHIISLDRQQDQSGLENIQITAQARLPQNQLGMMREQAKKISKPGETYKVLNVEFIPSDEEIRQAKLSMRQDIYQQVRIELDTLNKTYPGQNYYVHQIDFNAPPGMPMPMQNMRMNELAASAAGPSKPLDVGNKQELVAYVVLAAMPTELKPLIQSPTP